jgi:hypothetical protein
MKTTFTNWLDDAREAVAREQELTFAEYVALKRLQELEEEKSKQEALYAAAYAGQLEG